MDDIKVGDTVLVKAEVLSVFSGSYGGVKVRLPQNAGDREFSEGYFVRVDPDELKVGDRVDAQCNGTNRVIKDVLVRYRLEGSPNVIHARDELTILPPEPLHVVDYSNDTLRLLRRVTEHGNSLVEEVAMCYPDRVAEKIDWWSREYGIDADEVREMIAEPQVISKIRLSETVDVHAFRYANGWQAWTSNVDAPPIAGEGWYIYEEHACKLFKINGQYLERQ